MEYNELDLVTPALDDEIIIDDSLTSSVTPAYATAVLALSPTFYLRCQETSGDTLYDSTANALDASTAVSLSYYDFGQDGPFAGAKSIYFNNTGDGIFTIPYNALYQVASDGTGVCTVAFWLKHLPGFGSQMTVIQHDSGGGSNRPWSVFIADDGRIAPMMNVSSGTYAYGFRKINDANWHFVVVVFDDPNNQVLTYVDGKLDRVYTGLTSGIPSNTTSALRIGKHAGSSAYRLALAWLSEIAFWNGTILTANQISDLYAIGTQKQLAGAERRVSVRKFLQSTVFDYVIKSGLGDQTTTSTSFTPMPVALTNYRTVELEKGDQIFITLYCTSYNGGNNDIFFDILVGAPYTTNIYRLGSVYGARQGITETYGGTPNNIYFKIPFVAPETGTYAFRPCWRTSGGTAYIANASSGGTDCPFVFALSWA